MNKNMIDIWSDLKRTVLKVSICCIPATRRCAEENHKVLGGDYRRGHKIVRHVVQE